MESQVEEDGTAQIPPFFMSGLFLLFLDIYIYKKNSSTSVFFFFRGGRTEKEKAYAYENDTTVRKGQTLRRMH